MGLQEANTAAELVQRTVDPEANIIFGVVTDENLGDEIIITVIATGFDDEKPQLHSYQTNINNTDDSDETDVPAFLRNRGF